MHGAAVNLMHSKIGKSVLKSETLIKLCTFR